MAYSRLTLWIIRTSRRFGWVIAPQSAVDADAQHFFDKGRSEGRLSGIKAGQDIGIVKAIRYTEAHGLEEAQKHFNFDELDRKYPDPGLLP